jgi:hypothetical protein
MKRTLTGLAIIGLLAGCGTAPTPTTITQYQNVLISPTNTMLVHCTITPPPPPTTYAAASPQTREQLLRENDAANMGNLKTCNDRIDAVNQWIQTNLGIYSNDKTAVFVGQQPAVPVTASGVKAVAPSK